ncbi:hypothetical protein [Desertivirga arenae]|uniref:hypothetical protein n=1 Tax=Desertivirga arenae TaxID=2810309 RepID=UPI001A9731E0|nr:hypothetical protein [Pedobacter sp. SYSU D00823]
MGKINRNGFEKRPNIIVGTVTSLKRSRLSKIPETYGNLNTRQLSTDDVFEVVSKEEE